jgi:hypothetical protein
VSVTVWSLLLLRTYRPPNLGPDDALEKPFAFTLSTSVH